MKTHMQRGGHLECVDIIQCRQCAKPFQGHSPPPSGRGVSGSKVQEFMSFDYCFALLYKLKAGVSLSPSLSLISHLLERYIHAHIYLKTRLPSEHMVVHFLTKTDCTDSTCFSPDYLVSRCCRFSCSLSQKILQITCYRSK